MQCEHSLHLERIVTRNALFTASAGLVAFVIACGGGYQSPAPTEPPGTTTSARATTASLAYASDDGAIRLINADGSGQRQLLAAGEVGLPNGGFPRVRCPPLCELGTAWSPDGRFLAYVTGGGALRLLDADTTEVRTLDDGTGGVVALGPSAEAEVQWSPNSRYIAYQKAATYADTSNQVGLWIATPEGERRRLVDDSTRSEFAWSPDSQRIAYLGPHPADKTLPTRPLLVINADGSGLRQLSDNSALSPLGPSGPWSPDGHFLESWNDEGLADEVAGHVTLLGVDSGTAIALGRFTSDELPQWAPDASQLVFHNVHVNSETGEAQQLFERPSALLAWSPDVTKVALVEGSGPLGAASRSFVVLDLPTGERTVLHTSQASVSHADWPGYYGRWSPDSRYFAFVAAESDTRSSPGYAENGAALYVADTSVHAAVGAPVVAGFPYGCRFEAAQMAYSADNKHLLVEERFQNESPSIWVANPDGSSLARVIDGIALSSVFPHECGEISWRPPR